MAFETEAEAKNVAQKRRDAAKINAGRDKKVSLDDLFASVDAGNKEINVVLKADVRGSEEAVKNALEKIKEKMYLLKLSEVVLVLLVNLMLYLLVHQMLSLLDLMLLHQIMLRILLKIII